MKRVSTHSRRQRALPGILAVLPLVALAAIVLLASCGEQVSEEFSSIDTGLNGGGSASNRENTSSAPQAATASEEEPTEAAAAPAALADEEPAAEAETMEEGAPALDEETAGREEVAGIAEDDSLPGDANGADLAAEQPEPTPAPPDAAALAGAPAPLKAGERDDNAQFDDYQHYLASYQDGRVRPADVRERYVITILGQNQQPLLDARVQIFDEQGQQLFEGRTYAGGQTLFLPGALNVSDNVSNFRIAASKGNAQTEMTVARMVNLDNTMRLELPLEAAPAPETLRLDVLFLLDTTGSMADELARIQETIDSIAGRIDAFEPRPELRFGLVAYRDEGDDYVTREYDFTPDVPAFRQILMTFDADGGGDTPEALDEGLHQAIHGVQWADDAVRLIFLVADAGPHLDRERGYHYLSDTQQAVARGIKIYPIAASNTDEQAEYVFRQLAQQTMARFIFLTYQPGESSGAPGESTPLEAGEQAYTVERLDDLIVQVIQRELAAAVGAR